MLFCIKSDRFSRKDPKNNFYFVLRTLIVSFPFSVVYLVVSMLCVLNHKGHKDFTKVTKDFEVCFSRKDAYFNGLFRT